MCGISSSQSLDTHTHTFNSPVSGIIRASWYQKKHSPTHTHEEKKDSHRQQGPRYPLYGAFSQWGLLDPIKPAYNQSRLDGRLKLTARAFNRLWHRLQVVLVTVPTVMQNLVHPLSTSSITAPHLFLDFMVPCTVSEILALISQNFKRPRDLKCTPMLQNFNMCNASTLCIQSANQIWNI